MLLALGPTLPTLMLVTLAVPNPAEGRCGDDPSSMSSRRPGRPANDRSKLRSFLILGEAADGITRQSATAIDSRANSSELTTRAPVAISRAPGCRRNFILDHADWQIEDWQTEGVGALALAPVKASPRSG
jgi:hypothetical protein